MTHAFYKYNMEGAKEPRAYKHLYGDGRERVYHLPHHDALLLEVGKKYYTLRDGSLVAFKVESFSVMRTGNPRVSRLTGLYDIILATGEQITCDAFECWSEGSPIHQVFESIDAYNIYHTQQDKSMLYQERAVLVQFFDKYIDEGILCYCYDQSYNVVLTHPFLGRDEFNNIFDTYGEFERLWIDKDGLHYICHQNRVKNLPIYATMEECCGAMKIIDF